MKEVPTNWTSIKFKQVLLHKTKTTNHGLNCGSISFGNVVYKDNDKIPEETRASYQEVLEGEFLINPLNLNFDLKSLRTALSTLNVVVSTGYIVLQSKTNINKNYLRWLLFQFDVAHMKTLGAGVRQTVNYTDIGNEYFFMPPLQEQQTIANYLDSATAKIDTLIEKQTKLIELLKEKRQAVISTAVTRGLDPSVSMKDSGVEWLGEIPEGWVAKQYRYATKIYRGKFTHRPRNDPKFFDGEYPFIQTGDIARAGKYITTYTQTLNERGISVSEKFPKGTLVMTIAANIGDIAILDFETYAPDSIVGFSPDKSIDLMYLRYSFMSAIEALKSTAIKSTQANLNIDRIGSVYGAFPLKEEQINIANYLDDKTSKIDRLITKSTQAIELLKEKRTALISAVVTGKVDVRGIA